MSHVQRGGGIRTPGITATWHTPNQQGFHPGATSPSKVAVDRKIRVCPRNVADEHARGRRNTYLLVHKSTSWRARFPGYTTPFPLYIPTDDREVPSTFKTKTRGLVLGKRWQYLACLLATNNIESRKPFGKKAFFTSLPRCRQHLFWRKRDPTTRCAGTVRWCTK